MRSRAYLVAALIGGLASLVVTPSAQADDDDDDEDFDEGDGPEADSALVFTLDKLIEVAVRHAPDLSRAKLDRSVAKGKAGAARADQQWVMTMNGEYKGSGAGAQTYVPLFDVVASDSVIAGLGLGRNLPTGGNVRFEVGLGYTKQEVNLPDWYEDAQQLQGSGAGSGSGSAAPAAQPGQTGTFDDQYITQIQTTARMTFKQPLVRGFGPGVALAGQKRADYEYSAETMKAQLAAEDMVREIVAGYWDLAYASYEVETRAESLVLAQAQEKLTREELRAGKTAQNALNAVIYEIAVRQEAHLRAQLDAERKSLELRRKVGLGLGRREVLMRPGEAFEIGEAEWDIEEVLARSRKANRKLATIALQKKVADVDVDVTKNALLPQVDVSLSGALIGRGTSTGQSFSGLTGTQSGLDAQTNPVGGARGYEVMAGLSVSFELSGAAKSAHKAALARRRRLDVDRADLERQIDAEVVNAVKMVTSARTRVALSDKAISVAEDNVRAERLAFTAGKTTNFSVMQRQGELIEARLRRGRAVADYHVAVAQLQYLSGTLLEQYRINVRPRRSGR